MNSVSLLTSNQETWRRQLIGSARPDRLIARFDVHSIGKMLVAPVLTADFNDQS
jgi:hypothetical protein